MGASAAGRLLTVDETRRYMEAGVDPEGGLLFEPRVFWSVGYLDTASGSGNRFAQDTLILPRDHFRNGARWPIVLTRLSLCAINYVLRQYTTTPLSAATYLNDAASMLMATEVSIKAPQRQAYASKGAFTTKGYAARPTSPPSMRLAPQAAYSSGVLNVARMQFDKVLRLPQKAAIEVGVGSYYRPGIGGPVFPDSVPVHVQVEETGGIWGGGCRQASFDVIPYADQTEGPFRPSPFGAQLVPGGAVQNIRPQQVLTPLAFQRQNQSMGRAGSNAFAAVQFACAQAAYDDALQAAGANIPGAPIASLLTSLPVTMRSVNGGTGSFWWRREAPLGLVCTEQAPETLVYDLPQPITLNYGDVLEVSLRTPWRVTLGGVEPVLISPVFQLGVAVSGFAVVEG